MNMFVFKATAASYNSSIFVGLSCRAATPMHARTRKRMKQGFKSSLMHILNFAKHETYRKMMRYLHSHRALMGQEHPGAIRIGFDPGELRQDLQSMLYAEMPDMLDTAAVATTERLGAAPFTMPSQDVLDFISRRASLLSGLPDELYQRITDELSSGLNAGESLAQLSGRISRAFDDIEQGTAEVIADTETAAAFNYATNKAGIAAGATRKQWQHGGSKVPRPDHLAIDGLVVPIGEPYPVGEPPLMYPHDENGSPEDVINCSCVSIPLEGTTNG